MRTLIREVEQEVRWNLVVVRLAAALRGLFSNAALVHQRISAENFGALLHTSATPNKAKQLEFRKLPGGNEQTHDS